MHVVINQADALYGVDAENKLFAPAEETITFDVTFNTPQATLQGLSVALLSPDGQTLAHSLIEENKAVLNTNTAEAVAFVSGYSVGTEKMAFIAIGESSKPLAIIAVNVSPNPLADIAPPSTLAPTYPTSESLRAILSQMTAQAQRAEDAVEATEKAQKAVVQYVDVTFPTKVQEAEKRLENATVKASTALDDKAVAIDEHLEQTQTAIVANIDTKAQAVSTALDGKVSQAEQFKKDAETAKSDAVTAQGEASKSAEQASTSAEQAGKSAEQAEQAKTAIGDVGGRLDAVENGIKKALPYSLENYGYNVKAWLGENESNVLSIGGIAPAPVGFIATHGTKNPYARREVVWIKPNGERIVLLTKANDLANHPWLNYNNTTARTMWLDGDYVYIVTTSNSVTYRTSIHFVDGEPKDIVSVAVADADLTCTSAYSIKIADNFIIANNGQIFNAETLKVASTVTLATSRLVTASNAQGVYAMTSQGVVLITVDESGSPIITVKNSSKKYLPLANGKFVKGAFGTNLGWTKMFACEGGLSNSVNDSIVGNVVPALMNADIGTFVVNPFALYEVCSYGTSAGAVGYTMPIVRFPRSPKLYEVGNTHNAVKSGDAILINLIYNYILITKEELV